MTKRRSHTTAALEGALLREIAREYGRLALTHFKGRLKRPDFALTESVIHLGRWLPESRTLEISRAFVLREPWTATIEILKHEMAHQYVLEVLGVVEETAHGPTYRKVCHELGIDGRASGSPEVGPSPDEERLATRVAKLLALAESPNVHEAEAAMAAAQRLLLKYNVELAHARAERGYAFRHIGAVLLRTYEKDRALAALLAEHFFVEAIWVPSYRPEDGRHGSVLEICGTRQNLEIASYVHAFLVATAERLWVEHKRLERLRGDRDRRAYVAGVMAGFREKLRKESRRHQEEGLVWVKDADLGGFLRRRHPYVRHLRYSGERRNDTFSRGREAGGKIVLHKGVREGGDGGAPRLLPPRR